MEEPKIMKIGSYVPNGLCSGQVVAADGIAPTVMENHGMVTAVAEPLISVHPLSHALEFKGEESIKGISPALRATDYKCPHCVYEPEGASGCYDNQSGDFARKPIDGLARTVKTDHHNAVQTSYRIRRLTTRECFRLMDVDDADIDKIDAYRIKTTTKNGAVKEKPIPKSAKYKLAGNSICVNVLTQIFRCLFIPGQPENDRVATTQLTIFDI